MNEVCRELTVELTDAVEPRRFTDIGKLFRGRLITDRGETIALTTAELPLKRALAWGRAAADRVRLRIGDPAMGDASQWFSAGSAPTEAGDRPWHRGAVREVRDAYRRSAGTLWTVRLLDPGAQEASAAITAELLASDDPQSIRREADGVLFTVRRHFQHQVLEDVSAAADEHGFHGAFDIAPTNGAAFPGMLL